MRAYGLPRNLSHNDKMKNSTYADLHCFLVNLSRMLVGGADLAGPFDPDVIYSAQACFRRLSR